MTLITDWNESRNPTMKKMKIVMLFPDYGARVVLPLVLQGVTSSLNVHHVSEAEWTQEAAPRITLTKLDLHWDPNSSIYE